MNGIDISSWQSDISIANVNPGFVIAKISEGTSIRDKSFDNFYRECKSLNIPIGAYVYSHSTSAERGRAEAEYALNILGERKLELPIYLDIEGNILSSGKQALTESAISFANAVRAKGYKVGVYSSLYSYQAYLDVNELRNHDISIWLAQWGVSSPSISCDIWQKNIGYISGYNQEIDLDVMMGNIVEDLSDGSKEYSGLITDDAPTTLKLYPAHMSVLCRGFYGSQVVLLQSALRDRGYLNSVSGVYDQETESSVRAFQHDNGLIADGIAGEKTFAQFID